MSLIEGVGDEVIQFLTVVFVVIVATFAWWSTNARPDRYRTVLLMRSRTQHPITVNLLTRHNITSSTITLPTTSGPTVINTRIIATESNIRDDTGSLQEMDSIVDADMAMMDHHRLHFYRRMELNQPNQPTMENIPEETTGEEGQATNDQMREMDSIVNAMEGEVSTGCSVFARPNDESNSGTGDNVDNASAVPAPEDSGEKILIKLKYINDTSKEVDGSLDELLKDFKRRHFSAELCAERHVRLIFRGRVLGDDAATLRACGLHDRAVVHCLVHPRRAPRPAGGVPRPAGAAPPAGAAARAALLLAGGPGAGVAVHNSLGSQPAAEIVQEVLADPPQPERTWDLENILMTLVSVALTVVWFFRVIRENTSMRSPICDDDQCEYSNMFTASASVALFGLTVFYSVAIFGLYLSDTFHFERRPAHPVPPS